jgi:hypothetical protein
MFYPTPEATSPGDATWTLVEPARIPEAGAHITLH